jgi:hypothetical protein
MILLVTYLQVNKDILEFGCYRLIRKFFVITMKVTNILFRFLFTFVHVQSLN